MAGSSKQVTGNGIDIVGSKMKGKIQNIFQSVSIKVMIRQEDMGAGMNLLLVNDESLTAETIKEDID